MKESNVKRTEKFSQEEIQRANKSARSRGAVGSFPLCYHAMRVELSTKPGGQKILDFGAGPNAIHAKMMREDGYSVTAHDFGANVSDEIDESALTRCYSVVIASNVLNVQGEGLIDRTLTQLYDAVKPGGILIWNYPASPRYLGRSTHPVGLAETADQMLKRVMSVGFGEGTLVGGTRRSPVYVCRKV